MFSNRYDIDGRTGKRRYQIDLYKVHAYAIDVIRLSLMDTIAHYVRYLNDDASASLMTDYWAVELWEIDKALRTLGIED